jgi:hypothetical protein
MYLVLCLLISCWDCHKEIAEQYSRTPMANSSGRVVASAEPEGGVYHPASRTRYEVARDRDTLRLRWNGGSVSLAFFIGSRRMGRSYAFLEQGHLYQAPVGYYANKGAWDMAPGYALDRHPDFDRPITHECLFCHATGARPDPGTLNRIVNWAELQGVACERCHGDGAQHGAAPRRNNIVNPARLRGPPRSAVCEQCHLAGEARVVMPGKSLHQFQPGQELSDYLDVFVSPVAGGVRVAGHAEALARSRCAQAEELWCGTCHNPHRPASDYRQKCLGCHAVEQCPSPERQKGDCARCHMPKARAYDGGHTVFTDHSISRKPGTKHESGSDLSPFFDRPLPESVSRRNLGVAYAGIGALDKAWPLLRTAVQTKPRDAPLYAQVALLLEADGRADQAIEFYRLALEIDAEQDAALARLGLIMAHRGVATEALRLLRRSLHRNPRQPDLRRALAQLE